MKYSITFFTACLLLLVAMPTNTKAQTEKKTRMGIKGGINFSNLYTENSTDLKMLTGFNLGVFAKLPLLSIVSLQTELYYTTKGAEVTYDNIFANGTARFNFNYLEVPLLLMVNLSKNVNIHAGPYGAFMVSGKATNQSNVSKFNYEDNLDPDDYNRFDAGIVFGLGVDFGALSLAGRYNYGLNKVGKERNFFGTNYTFPDANNGVLSICASVGLN